MMSNDKQKYKKVPIDVSIHLRYLHQDLGLSLKELQNRYPKYKKTSIHRHSKKPFDKLIADGRHANIGRPSKLSDRDIRHLESSLLKLRDEVGDLHSGDIQQDCKITCDKVSNRTI